MTFTGNVASIGDHTYTREFTYSPVSNVIGKTSTNNTYGMFYALTGANALTYCDLMFDTTSIPKNAKISSITVQFKCNVNSTSYITTRRAEIIVNKSPVGDSVQFDSNNRTIRLLSASNPDTMPLLSIGIRITIGRGTRSASSNASCSLYFATVTVEYEIPADDVLYFKKDGQYVKTEKVYLKQNGVWVEVDDISSIFSGAQNDTWSGYFVNK